MRLKIEDASSDIEAVMHRTICAAYILFEIMLHVVELDGNQTVEKMILLFPLDLLSSSRKVMFGIRRNYIKECGIKIHRFSHH